MGRSDGWKGLKLLPILVLLFVALPSVILFIIVPLDIPLQFLMGASMAAAMLLLNRIKSYWMTLALIVLSVAVSTRYLYWRTTETLVFSNGIEAFLGIGLYLAEIYAWVILVIGYFQSILPLQRPIVPMPDDTSTWPTVDVYIPTYNESLSVVQDTVLAAMDIDYPADKLRVYVLDDGKRPEFGAFAAAAGAGYITRTDNNHAKAGNLNHAMTKTDGELICIFDCDHVSTRAFLQATVGQFLVDPKLALVQTPHHFYSPDPFERNLANGQQVPNEGELFYGPVQQGNDYWNAAFFCGSCAVIRRSALEETNGFATETVTEDAHTALKLQRTGWNTAFIAVPLAAGLATERLSLHIGQRMRWARGMTQIFRRDNPLLGRGLKLPQRLCYLNAMLHFQFALPRIIFLTAPMCYLMLGQNIISSSAAAIFSYALPHLVHSITTNARIQGKHRHSFWGEIYETVLAFHILKPTLVTLVDPKRGKFNVTDKGGLLDRGFFDFDIVKPHLLTLGLLIVAMIIGTLRHFWIQWIPSDPNVLLLNLLWASFSAITLMAAIATAMEQRQLRSATRLEVKLPAVLHFSNGRTLRGTTRDISMGGVRVVRDGTGRDLPGQLEEIELIYQGNTLFLPVDLMGTTDKEVRLRFPVLDIPRRRELVGLVMGRADAWLENGPMRTDSPLRSLMGVMLNALSLLRWRRHGKASGATPTAALSTAATPIPRPASASAGFARAAILILLAALTLGGLSVVAHAAPANAQADSLPDVLTLPRPVNVKTQPVASTTETVDTLRFSQLGVTDVVTLRGERAEIGLPFSFSSQQVVTAARLDLHFIHGRQIPDGSRLEVLVNNELVRQIPLSSGQDVDLVESVPINPLLLVPYNRLNLRLRSDQPRCEDPNQSPLWVSLAKDSSFTFGYERLPLASELSMLPAPFFDPAQMGDFKLPFVMAASPSETTLRNAALVASYFGTLAQFRNIDFPVSLDALPLGNAVVILGPNERIQELNLPTPDVRGSLAIVDNPRDPLGKLLVISGESASALRSAALTLTTASHELTGARSTASVTQVAPRHPYDAPNWIPASRPIRFLELAKEELVSEAVAPASMRVGFRAAPDTFLWNGGNIPMRIKYRFPDGDWFDAAASHLDIALNGRYLTSVPVLKPGVFEKLKNAAGFYTRQEEAVVEIPSYLIFGQNQLDFFFNTQFTPDPDCTSDLPDRALSQIDPDSQIDLTRTQHFAQLPNLSFFVGAGFPFTRLADLSETVVVLPEVPRTHEIQAMLMMLGRFGAATGYPATGVELTVGKGATQTFANRDLLVVGQLDERANLAQWLDQSVFRVEGQRLRVRPDDTMDKALAVLSGDWTREGQAADRQLSGERQFQGLVSRRSPFDRNRVVVLALATDPDWLPRIAGALNDPLITPEIRGDLTVFEAADRVQSFRTDALFSYGELPWWVQVRWLFRERPLVLMVLVLGSTALVATAMYPLLRARVRRRLR